MDLSIIVVSYNTRRLLDDCLRSLYAAAPPPGGLEVIVVDNASADGSPEMVCARYPQARLIVSAENRGYSAANNQGAAVAEGDYLLYLNSDTVVAADALVKPLTYLQDHPEVGALTVRLVYPNGERDPDNHRGFPTPWNAFCHFTLLSRLFPHSPRFNGYFRYPLVEVVHYKGASSGLRKESADIARPPKATRVKVAEESVRAMRIFYGKFYSDKYPRVVTALVLAGIQARGWLRIMKHRLS
jgi:GT2 family glycosyltransferase